MIKAVSTSTPSRRALLRGATAVAILAPAATIGAAAIASMPDLDAKLIALIDRARIAFALAEAAAAEHRRTFALVEADPERPDWTILTRDTPRTVRRLAKARAERVYRRHGYDVACDVASAADRQRDELLLRVVHSRPKTSRGAMLQAAIILDAIMAEDTDFGELCEVQDALPGLLAHMRRVAT